ncbi:MAG: poly-beta-1,6-N-acetyl-D-glucosamine biosynthesis protein PgaD [Candidatus Competibacteraceae bacterium]|nr:MAG: poly-beta-1,6-N-acetyl-D-glucosamine biosynthesis protein PgaD [Candidatus Competibacteraceae bacterium]
MTNTHALAFIIDSPSLQSTSKRIVWKLVTLIFWGLWFYLWLPLATLIAWMLGIYIGYQEIIVLQSYRQALVTGEYYILIAALLGGTLIIWALVQWLRFHNRERRKRRPDIGMEALAVYYQLDPSDLRQWQTAQRLIVHHDERGYPVKADRVPPDWFCPLLQSKEDLESEPLQNLNEGTVQANGKLSFHASQHDPSDVVLL